MNFVKLENDKLDVSSITDLVADEACGAISVFVGITRDNFEDKKVVSLEYEAYEPMAVKSLTALCDELRTKWPDIKHIAIHHRLGSVPVKEKSIVIAISSPHRETSLHAVHHAIDTLKTTIPIWKKECYDDSQTTWKENKESSAVSSKTRLERSQLNFESCPCDAAPISKNLVQITADEAELTRRIQCFVEKKREEIDTENISCFTEKLPTNIDQSEVAGSCARVNSTVFRQKDSDGYVKVRRVKNEIGPQIKPDYASTLNKLMGNTLMPRVKQERVEASSFESLPPGLEERLENVEKFLGQNTKPAPRTLYERVKYVEDRLLYLESISPEYYHFLGEKPPPDDIRRRKKPNYSVEDLDRYIADIQKNI